MTRTFSVTQSSFPPLSILQGAYKSLFAGDSFRETQEGDWTITPPYLFLFSPPTQIAVATEPPVEDWVKFQRLVGEWQNERGASSSITEAALCPAYQSIIGMGEKAVPFILAQLKAEGEDPDQWFWALSALTGADPVRDEDRGNYSRMAQSWLQWAETSEYAR